MAGPSIASTSPSSGATGVPTNITISVTFDQEVDTFRLKNGGIFLEGPDESKAIGPGMLDLDPPETDEDEFLSSPGFLGIKKDVDYTFSRVDGSGESVDYYDYGDTSGAGQLYRTKVTLTPQRPLQSLTEHTVHIVGDEDTSDEYDFGLSTRTVFDPIKGANLSNSDVVFYGGYTGSLRQQFSVQITTGGAPGTAEYEWWTSTDPLHRVNKSSLGYRTLKEGVSIKFLDGQIYEVGDLFTVWCDVPIFMEGRYEFSFTTSSQEPETLPIASTALTGISSSASSTSTSNLTVSSTDPVNRSALNSSNITSVSATFSSNLDITTVNSSSVSASGYAANGYRGTDPEYTGALTLVNLEVVGAVLTITLDPDEIFDNNVVTIMLDETIADTNGNSLAEDYSFYFGTEYDPFYAGIRQVKLRLGNFGSYYPDETIALAIWDASKEADAFAPHIDIITDSEGYIRAREQFVVCFAAWILVSGGTGSLGESVRKRLGDFDVSRSPSGASFDDDLKDCISYYQAIMDGGGVLGKKYKPVNVVKGDYDTDSPHFGRLWEIPEVPVGNARVLYTDSRRWYKTHLGRLSNSTNRSRWRRN
jgi:hypothetical protein